MLRENRHVTVITSIDDENLNFCHSLLRGQRCQCFFDRVWRDACCHHDGHARRSSGMRRDHCVTLSVQELLETVDVAFLWPGAKLSILITCPGAGLPVKLAAEYPAGG